MKVSLSFDNGPTPDVTPGVLDTLAANRVPASFFVLGSKIESDLGCDLVRRAKEEGHRVGNHTYSHTLLFGSEKDQTRAISEIDRTQALLGTLGQERLFRPSGAGVLDCSIMSTTVFNHLRAQAFTCVLWNSVPRDWEDPAGWPDRALRDVCENRWTVIVVHDLPTGAMDVLDSFLKRARDMGAQFVPDFPSIVTPLVNGCELWSMQERQLISEL